MLCITVLFCLNSINQLLYLQFDEVWPYINSVYTMRVQKYECRLWKSSKPGTARVAAEGKVIKRRNSSVRDKHLCYVRIKTSRPVDGSAVTIGRLDEHTHTQDIEESFRIKKPSILVGYIKSEAAKNYSSAQIFHALRSGITWDLQHDREHHGCSKGC